MLRKREACQYDIDRKKETIAKLKQGIKKLKVSAKYKDRPITEYALSKITGVSRLTIKKYPEIVEYLNNQKNPGVKLKTAVVNTEKIYTLEQAIAIIETLSKTYNESKDKYNELLKTLSEANLKIARLQTENLELKNILNSKKPRE